ncbi:Uncharacterised protein [uncultured archaeon]|nr:Uncharacterised protein [uncultured archaeon]
MIVAGSVGYIIAVMSQRFALGVVIVKPKLMVVGAAGAAGVHAQHLVVEELNLVLEVVIILLLLVAGVVVLAQVLKVNRATLKLVVQLILFLHLVLFNGLNVILAECKLKQ